MTHNTILALDNGVSGTVAVTYKGEPLLFRKTPVVKVRNYTKKEAYLRRIDHKSFKELIRGFPVTIAYIERPLVNPKAFVATESALRSLEATIICLEQLEIPYEFIDSKTWQKHYLTPNAIGSTEMKLASKEVGKIMFPKFADEIEKHGDADSLFIALYASTL